MHRGVMERFISKIKLSDNGCWEWTGQKMKNGYGTFSVDGSKRLAHRFSYDACNMEPAGDNHVHHTCCNRGCVNPWHLQALPIVIHIMESPNHSAYSALNFNECRNGHHLSGENLGYDYKGNRFCKKCRKEWWRRRALTTPSKKSPHKGVYWNRITSRWRAIINVDGKETYIGSFEIAEDAISAYQKKYRELFGLMVPIPTDR